MPKSEVFRINYYVGAVLAQGGNLWFDDAKIVFSPTSAIDRALGASDVEIPFFNIEGVGYKGDLSRIFQVKTKDKLHRFHGSQAKRAWEELSKALQDKGMRPMAKAVLSEATPAKKIENPTACKKCSGRLQPNFVFCPYCGTRTLPS